METGVDDLVIESAKRELKTLNDLEDEVSYKVEIAEKIFEEVRLRLEENMNTKSRPNGCLRGEHIDEYIESMEAQRLKMKARFDLDRQYLQAKINK